MSEFHKKQMCGYTIPTWAITLKQFSTNDKFNKNVI